MKSKPLISVVIPIFNGSKYLRKTLESIFNQNFSDYEVICVNDCSTDNSEIIIKEYSDKDPRFKLFTTNKNLGIVPKVINFVSPFISGDYFVYSSQDDIFSDDWLGCMYAKAQQSGADAVIPDLVFYHENNPNKNRLISGLLGDKNYILTSREAVTYSLDWTIPGNALWNIRLLREIGFYDFGMNADEYTVRVFYSNCNKIVFSDGIFFYRQDNPDAITKKLSLKTFDLPYTNLRLFLLLRDKNFPLELQINHILLSIRGLIYFNSLTFFSKSMRPGKKKIRYCFDQYIENSIFKFLNDNYSVTPKRKVLGLASNSYFVFQMLSYFVAIKRVIRNFIN